MSNLISAEELTGQLSDPRLRVVDARFDLGDTASGERSYLAEHIPGAVYAHLDRDLSGPLGEHGGRHPLPDPEVLAQRLGSLGIGDGSRVVAYDEENGMFASRVWWLLRWLGFDEVKVLDGGFRAWRELGLPTAEGEERPRPARLTARPRGEMIVGRDDVLASLGDPRMLLIDARAPERYRGEVEPIDPKAGHIPGAINLPFAGNLAQGRFLAAEDLATRYAAARDADEVVVYCGSGVTAAHDLLALEEAGIEGARLYPGSWSDWCSYPNSPVGTGEGSREGG